MLLRASIVAVFLLTAALGLQRASGAERVPERDPVTSLPLAVGGWQGRDLPAWDPVIVNQVGADEYVNRRYLRGAAVADLYVGYYRSQRRGDMIHSPQNCLPGAGWQPVSNERVPLEAGRDRIHVNRYVIQKDLDRQVVLYWFQGRGRAVANEYMNRAYLIADSLRLHRTDGALVRIMAPVVTTAERAAADAGAFAAAIYPALVEVAP
jgi:EpsI family protein